MAHRDRRLAELADRFRGLKPPRFAAALFQTRRAAVVERLDVLRVRTGRETRQDFNERESLELELRQIDEGARSGDGMSPELWAIQSRPEVAVLRLPRAGLGTIAALRARLVAKRDAELAKAAEVWPRPFRYTGRKFQCQLNGEFLEPGAIVELSEQRARAWATASRRSKSTNRLSGGVFVGPPRVGRGLNRCLVPRRAPRRLQSPDSERFYIWEPASPASAGVDGWVRPSAPARPSSRCEGA